MKLLDYADMYIGRRDCSDGHARQMRFAVSNLMRWAGDVTTVDLDENLINGWIKYGKGYWRDSTRRQRRTYILALWREAANDPDLGNARPDPPNMRRIASIRVRDYLPKCLTHDQVCSLLRNTNAVTGRYVSIGVDQSDWWQAYLRVAWDSGLATCDVLSLKMPDVELGEFQVLRRKTGKPVYVRLAKTTLAAVDVISGSRDLAFPLPVTQESMRCQFKKIVTAASLPSWASLKHLRSGSGCSVELQAPGMGHQHLANSQRVFNSHYEVESLTAPARPRPQPLPDIT